MLREPTLLIRAKVAADLASLSFVLLIIQAGFGIPGSLSLTSNTLVVLGLHCVCWLFSASAFRLYSDFRMKPFSIEWVLFLKAFGMYCLTSSFIFSRIFGHYGFEQGRMLVYYALVFLTLPAQKLTIRILFKRLRNSQTLLRRVLIVGAGDTGINFYRNYVSNKHYGYQLTGFVDDEKQPALNGHYLGRTSELETVIAKHPLDDIVVALPAHSEARIQEIINVAEREGKRVKIIPDYGSFGDGKLAVDSLGSLSIISVRSLPLDVVDSKFYKRIFDIVFSLAVIVCLMSWLLPVVAILIKLTSKGPVLFKQQRWGLNNKNILCWKFRSMQACSTDVDEQGAYRQACKDDPRITPVGRLLRKTNIDELPQFFNVLIGSMSVVGPRPHPVPLNMESKDSVEKYMMRHWVKPGITGWAQVHGYRGETKDNGLMKARVKHDLWYIENWTFWLDLQIIVQTLVNTVKGEKNAY